MTVRQASSSRRDISCVSTSHCFHSSQGASFGSWSTRSSSASDLPADASQASLAATRMSALAAAPTGGTARCATMRCASIESAGDGPTTASLSRSRIARSTGVPRQMVVVRLAAASPDGSRPISATPKLVTTSPRVRLTVAVAVTSSSVALAEPVSAGLFAVPPVAVWVDGVGDDPSVSLTLSVAAAGATASLSATAAEPLSSEMASMASSMELMAGVGALLLSGLLAVMVARRSTGPLPLSAALPAGMLPAALLPVACCAAAGIEISNAPPRTRPTAVRLAWRLLRRSRVLFRKIFIRDDLVHDNRRRRDLPCRQRDQTGGHKAGHNNQNNTNSIHIRSAIRPGRRGALTPTP